MFVMLQIMGMIQKWMAVYVKVIIISIHISRTKSKKLLY